MSILLNCQAISKSFGSQSLFENINFTIQSGDRIGLIGPNGSGKSTLLKILSASVRQDKGEVILRKHTRISYLAQQDSFDESKSVADNLFLHLQKNQGQVSDESDTYYLIQTLISRAEFPDPDSLVNKLSGGWRKRLAICCALVTHPDIMIMDEPTNHLDIEGILWLEKLITARLPDNPAAFLMVSHDRRFLENSASRIIELSAAYPDGSLQVQGTYSDFLSKKEEFLKQQENLETRLSNKMRRETEWLSRGPKARATKAKYRIDAAGELSEQLGRVKARNRAGGQVNIDFVATGRKTKKLLHAKGISKGYETRVLFDNLDLELINNSRLGLLGRNGCGKSTLMQLFAHSGEHEPAFLPDQGEIDTADNVRIVFFDQRREQLNQDETLKEALSPDGDSILYRGKPVHVVTWAKRFLFRPDQLETPVSRLSGGEQARILIARLMLQPADILLLDEPTNDLDIPSLDMLAESLSEFPGALVLVTHDRHLLERVCGRILGFDGHGKTEFFSDYQQWLNWLKQRTGKGGATLKKKGSGGNEKDKKSKKTKKLSYMEQREHEDIEGKIPSKEKRLEGLKALLADEKTIADHAKVNQYWQEQQELEQEIEQLYNRWEELESRGVGKV
jgi:ATP-binding cassette subfamily F protein uup